MKNFKIAFPFVLGVFLSGIIRAQTLNDAVKKTMNERYEAATADFRVLLRNTPSDAATNFFCGDNYYYWGELDSAATMFEKGLAADAANPLNHVGLGRQAWIKNNPAKCAEHFTKAHSLITAKGNKIPLDIQQIVLLKMAETYIRNDQKNLDQANAYIQQALKLDDKNPEVYIQWGDLELEKEGSNRTNSINQYEKAFSVDPKYTRALLRQGQLWKRVENYDLALEWLDKAIANDRTFAPAYREKGDVLFKTSRKKPENMKLAADEYRKYLELNDSPTARTKYAGFLIEMKEFKLALEELNKIMQKDSSNIGLYRALGYCGFETKDYAKGLYYMKKFFDNVGSQSQFTVIASDHVYLGKLMTQTGQDTLGVEEMKKAIALDPKNPEPYGELGALYYKLKKYPEAATYYQLKLDNSKRREELDYFYLAKSLYFSREYEKADSAFSSATSYAESYFWKGQCNAKLDSLEVPVGLARPHFETFIRKVGNDPKNIEPNKKNLIQAYSYLGYIHYIQKNFDCSKSAWMKVQELDAANEKARIALEDPEVLAAPGTCVLLPVP